VGRFPQVLSTKTLTLEEIINIITGPKNAIVKQYAYQFAFYGVDLHITPEALNLIAQNAILKNTGARGLKAVFEKLLTTTMYIVPDDPTCHTILIDEEAVKGTRSVLLLRGDLTVEDFLSGREGVDGTCQGFGDGVTEAYVEMEEPPLRESAL
jgi:ATP-dependent Clp protease ATP-binding subunit ClpX